MRIIKRIAELRQAVRGMKRRGRSIGFVPTMGALHEGHLSLIRKARRETDWVIVSLFINPIQFNRRSDFRSYPRVLAQDARKAAGAGADALFAPSAVEIYPPDFQTSVEVERLSRRWEGRSRPGHFRGVATVVAKLFHLVQPDIAYFGQKDAQQARIVRQMIRDLNFDIRLRILPTIRELGGLAMSSRNQLLSSSARRPSRLLFEALQEARRLIQWGERRGSVVVRRMRQIIHKSSKARIDYAAIVNPKTLEPVEKLQGKVQVLLAVWIGPVRLIDNIQCYVPS
ncbi:MAG: pantoate--beta-alanine ligase [Candidatus Omnitrophica bacterium]|nr:pantoate--beta-alanine ligase [Candidatus Omnitrophota bacterium]